MYVGHLALGLAARRVDSATPIAVLTSAPVALDLGAGVLGVLGLDPAYHWTHTLPAACLWTLTVGLLAGAWRGPRAGLLVGALVATHLPLDYVTGTLPLWTGGPTLGLNLCAYPFGDYALEVAMVLVAWLSYWGTLPRDAPHRRLALLMLPMMAILQMAFSFIHA
jgi:hypothetical protein